MRYSASQARSEARGYGWPAVSAPTAAPAGGLQAGLRHCALGLWHQQFGSKISTLGLCWAALLNFCLGGNARPQGQREDTGGRMSTWGPSVPHPMPA